MTAYRQADFWQLWGFITRNCLRLTSSVIVLTQTWKLEFLCLSIFFRMFMFISILSPNWRITIMFYLTQPKWKTKRRQKENSFPWSVTWTVTSLSHPDSNLKKTSNSLQLSVLFVALLISVVWFFLGWGNTVLLFYAFVFWNFMWQVLQFFILRTYICKLHSYLSQLFSFVNLWRATWGGFVCAVVRNNSTW